MKLRVSRFGQSIGFAGMGLIGLICIRLAFRSPDSLNGDISLYRFTVIYLYFCILGFLLFALAAAKYYILSERGIEHKLFGICFCLTTWDEVCDVMYIPQQQGDRRSPPVMMFTVDPKLKYRPNEKGIVTQKGFRRDWLWRRRLFMVDVKRKQKDQLFAIIRLYYGEVDYDYYEQKRKNTTCVWNEGPF